MGNAVGVTGPGTWKQPSADEENQPKPVADKPYAPLPGTYSDGPPIDASRFSTPGPTSLTGEQQKDTIYDQGNAATNDAATSRLERDRLLTGYQSYTDRAAPTTGGVTAPTAATAAPTTVGAPAPIAPTAVGPAAQAGAAPAVVAGTIAPTAIGPAATYGASKVATTGPAVAGAASASPIDTAHQAQFRSDQQKLITGLQGAANGTVPSAAEAQLQRASDQAIQTQASLAAGAHGTSRLTQRLMAGYNTADLQQKAALDTAQVRAQEQATARGQLGQALEGARGQDIGLATTGATLATDVSKTNAGLATNVSISNADRAAAAAMKDADLQQAAASGNAAAINEIKSRQAQITSAEGIATAGNQTDVSKTNAGNATAIELANTQSKNRMTELQAQISSQQGIATAEQQNELTKLQAQITSGEGQFNAGQANDITKQTSALQLQAKVADMDAQLKARGMDDAQRASLLDAYIKEQQQALGYDSSTAALEVAKQGHSDQLLGSIVQGVATAGAAALPYVLPALAASDERAKTNIRPTSDKEMKLFINALGAHDYEYKDKADGAGDFTGPMAQELEKSKIGRSTVVEGPDGKKRVDTRRLTLALASAVARMSKEAA